jgi:hypothetical protein
MPDESGAADTLSIQEIHRICNFLRGECGVIELSERSVKADQLERQFPSLRKVLKFIVLTKFLNPRLTSAVRDLAAIESG